MRKPVLTWRFVLKSPSLQARSLCLEIRRIHKSRGVRIMFLWLLIALVWVPFAWGTAQLDTLRPVSDQNVTWTKSGCTGHYECVDDVTADGWNTYVYTPFTGNRETFKYDSTFAANIDSLVIYLNAWATGGEIPLEIGWDYWSEGLWMWNTDTTINLPGDATPTAYSRKASGSWTYQLINDRRFGVRTGTVESGRQTYLTQIYLIVYYQEVEEVAKKQGGIVQDENNRGMAEGGIAK
ncbi:MAG: hypothetical protein ACE5K2_00300 [Candidatus Zixiibacteriota bacterium]